MSGWQFSFPLSRACLWDPTPAGQTVRLHLTKNSWMCVRLLPSAVQLAVRHARQAPSQQLECLLVGSGWTTEVEGVAVEVNRFDPGRLLGDGRGVAPTALIPGDVAIPCQVMAVARSETTPLPHNLMTLQDSLTALHSALVRPHPLPYPLDPTSLLSLRVHCVFSEDGPVYVQCVCVNPGPWCEATPLPPLPVVQTALARNLVGPLPLSVLQGRVREGFLTMEATRKLVLLLNSDPKASTLPLVGIWVSGVGSVHHPLVWAACLHYCHAPSPGERVWGEDGTFLLAVYPEGTTQPGFWQCRVDGGTHGSEAGRFKFEISHGECTLQPESGRDPVTMEMHPAPESTALHTLLVAAEHTHTTTRAHTGTPAQAHTGTPAQAHTTMQAHTGTPAQAHTTMQAHTGTPAQAHTGTPAQAHTGTPAQQHQRGCQLSDSCDSPLPSPHPTPAQPPQISHDCELSCLSLAEQHPPGLGSEAVERTGGLTGGRLPMEGREEPSLSSPLAFSHMTASPPSTCSGHSIVVFPEKQQRTKGTTTTEELLWRQELQLKKLQEQVNALLSQQSPGTPRSMADAYTSTGVSLLCPASPLPSLPHPSESSQYTSDCFSVATGTALSVATATSLLSHDSSALGLDMPSYAHSPSPPTSPSLGDSASIIAERVVMRRESAGVRDDGAGGRDPDDDVSGDSPTALLFRDQQKFYQNMLAQVNELLDSQPEGPPTATSTTTPIQSPQHSVSPPTDISSSPSSYETHQTSYTSQMAAPTTLMGQPHVPAVQLSSEVSMLPVPRIMCPTQLLGPGLTFSLASGDCTVDEHGRLADMIALKYLPGGVAGEQGPSHPALDPHVDPSHHGLSEEPSALLDMSMATQQYLRRYHLTAGAAQDQPSNVLDIQRLKALPKLI